MIRRVKRSVCQLLIGILLFSQMALAAYACPQLSSAEFSERSAMPTMGSKGSPAGADTAMAGSETTTPVVDMAPGCPEMGQADPDNPNLCVEQVHFGQQSDQTQTPTVPAVVLSNLYTLPLLPEPTGPTRPAAAAASLLAATSPPHAILHCCFRH
ncbi:hypothetical protein [Aromatoleum evansii]|uniref:hypothetical protein n=1 Tax=Aromatoleum evansii TaxID=59406 RepID=UPI001FE398A6|nr:hypothetical protein [Aromatoleum evansii]